MAPFMGISGLGGASPSFAKGVSYVTGNLVLFFDAANSSSYSGSGTTWTDIINGNTATMHDGVDYQNIYGGVMNYDGTDDRIALPNTALPSGLGATFTIEIWNYWNNGTAPSNAFGGGLFTYAGGAGEWNTAGNNNGLIFGYNWITRRNSSGTQINTAYSPAPAVETWHQTVLTVNSGTGNVYVDKNNVLSDSTDFQSDYAQSNGTMGIGISDIYSGTWRGEMNGYISIVRIYDKVLSTAEIEQNFDSAKGRYNL